MRETAPVFRQPTIEQLEGFVLPVWEELVDGARYVDERLREIFDELEPDAIVEDNVVAFPAVPASGRPWVRIVSCNPLELRDPALPPAFSGLPVDGPDAAGTSSGADYDELHAPLQREFSAFCEERGAPPLPDGDFIHESPYLDLYLYPERGGLPRAPSRSLRPGTGSTPACAAPTRRSTLPARATARSSTSRSGASAPPTSS